MADRIQSIDYWRKFFRSANTDIFELIDKAIVVAASDYADEFAAKRDRIAETLYTCRIARCGGGCGLRQPEEKEGKVNSSCDDPSGSYDADDDELEEMMNRKTSSYSYDEAQALTDEIQEENETVGEVLRIKEVLENQEDESDKVLFESLRRLELMEISYKILEGTQIGITVNGLRKHKSKQIRNLARTLIEYWKVLALEWVKATSAIADTPPESINPSVISEEDWFSFPPLDQGAILATQTAPYEMSEIFEEFDEDGNPIINAENQKKNESKPQLEKSNPVRKQQILCPEDKGHLRRQETVTRHPKPQDTGIRPPKPQGNLNSQIKPAVTHSGPGRPSKLAIEQKPSGGTNPDHRQDQAGIPKKPTAAILDSDESSVRARLEISKRKLHEGYRQAENAKKQRTIQVMELHDLPKQAHTQRQPNVKPRNNIRNLLSGRR